MGGNEKLPVTIVICALNEEGRIKDAIESARKNNPAEVIVVEGGSTDKTLEIAKQCADNVYEVEPFNLGNKRYQGVLKATQPYILNMDADQVIDPGLLEVMLKELQSTGWVGIQTQLKSYTNESWWEEGMEATLGLTHGGFGERTMIGTPALYRRDILLENNFNPAISGASDDTDLCYRLTKKGFKLGISSVVCFQKHRVSFTAVYKKFYWYGQSDFQFGNLHPERMLSIFTHPIRNYMFFKPLHLIKKGQAKYAPFPFIAGIFRHVGFWKGFINYLQNKNTDSRIENSEDYDY